ncbi:MAG: sulfite exporter TauE/SafE family protein [Verrucomicrobiales bacterium]|nr:sulfite exporter TauE/SafE family protein [Verrucomicrobiales bacterium]
MMDPIIPLLAAILFAAAFLQSATGFGMALVCTALIPLLLPVKEAIAFVSIACFIATIFIMLLNRSGLSFRHAGPLALGMLLGIPIGYYGLKSVDGTLVVRILGITLMLIALAEFLQSRYEGKRKLPEKSAGIFGLIGGVITGAFNVGGPPVVIYAYSRPWSKTETVAILQSVFLTGSITRNALMWQAGEFTKDLLFLVLCSIPTALIGIWLGKKTLDRLPQVWLRRTVFGLIFVIGLKYVIEA